MTTSPAVRVAVGWRRDPQISILAKLRPHAGFQTKSRIQSVAPVERRSCRPRADSSRGAEHAAADALAAPDQRKLVTTLSLPNRESWSEPAGAPPGHTRSFFLPHPLFLLLHLISSRSNLTRHARGPSRHTGESSGIY